MNYLFFCFTFLIFSLSNNAWADKKKLNLSTRQVKNEILVQFKNSMTIQAQTQMLERRGHQLVRKFKSGNWHHVKIKNEESIDQVLQVYKSDPNVLSVQPNYIYKINALPNDPNFGLLWALKNTGQTIAGATYRTSNPGINTRDMSLEAAWNQITDCSSVIVAILDTGIQYNHQDLAANLWSTAAYPNHGYNFVNDTNDPMDDNGHGSHVAGTIGAVGNNAVGSAGVCWKSRLMAVKILDASGSGSSADIINGVNFAVNNGAKVINMSFGGSAGGQAEQDAITNAGNQGVVVVVAAGNDATDNDNPNSQTYPCNYGLSNMVCVAALDQAYGLATFSNYGATKVHVGAPGTNISSSWIGTVGAIGDDFKTNGVIDWTRVGTGWAATTKTFNSGGMNVVFDVLVNPPNWDGSTQLYTNNMDARAYKVFNLVGYDKLELDFFVFLDTEINNDFFNVNASRTGGDPFVNGTQVVSGSGSTNGSAENITADISTCNTATCSVGFQMTSDNAGTDFGAAILAFQINTLIKNNTSYNVINGTSMATPHVTGLAAMIMAYNPSYTVADVVQSIKNGGTLTTSLSGKTSTGRAVNAMGSLSYIAAPTGVSAGLR